VWGEPPPPNSSITFPKGDGEGKGEKRDGVRIFSHPSASIFGGRGGEGKKEEVAGLHNYFYHYAFGVEKGKKKKKGREEKRQRHLGDLLFYFFFAREEGR